MFCLVNDTVTTGNSICGLCGGTVNGRATCICWPYMAPIGCEPMIRAELKKAIENSKGWPKGELHPGPAADAAIEVIKGPLYEFIAHGDEQNRAWLKEAIDGFFDGRTRDQIVERGR